VIIEIPKKVELKPEPRKEEKKPSLKIELELDNSNIGSKISIFEERLRRQSTVHKIDDKDKQITEKRSSILKHLDQDNIDTPNPAPKSNLKSNKNS
jgi:hypothetical protein